MKGLKVCCIFFHGYDIVKGEREYKFNTQPVMHHTDTDFSYYFNNTGVSLTPPGEKTWHLMNTLK